MLVSVVICTEDRPVELTECVKSLFAQSITPSEIIVVDGSEGLGVADCIHDLSLLGDRIPLLHVRTWAGLTHQRNVGVERCKGDLILFLDDDVILEPHYVARILEVFERDLEGCIGGVEGEIVNADAEKEWSWKHKLFDRLFLLCRRGSGRILPSGENTWCVNSPAITHVDTLCGCACYRREVFDDFRFDEGLPGYGLGEDVDFSYRVSTEYKLVHTPHARLVHKCSPRRRDSVEQRKAMAIYNRYYLFAKNMPHTPVHWLCHIWSHMGLILWVLLVQRSRPGVVQGTLKGYGQIWASVMSKRSVKSRPEHS